MSKWILFAVVATALAGCSWNQSLTINYNTIFSGSISGWKEGEKEVVYSIYNTGNGSYQDISSAKINSNGTFSVPSVAESQLRPYLITDQDSYLVSCNGPERLSSSSYTSKSQQGTFFVYSGGNKIGTLELATFDKKDKSIVGDIDINPKFSTEKARVQGYQSQCYGRNVTVDVDWNSTLGWNNSISTVQTVSQGVATSYKITTGNIPANATWRYYPYNTKSRLKLSDSSNQGAQTSK
jgi:hypothetical protein